MINNFLLNNDPVLYNLIEKEKEHQKKRYD